MRARTPTHPHTYNAWRCKSLTHPQSVGGVATSKGAYPSWYYNQGYGPGARGWSVSNPIVCEPQVPTAAAAAGGTLQWAAHEADMTIQNPGDAWFWHKDHAHLSAGDLFDHWLQTVGKGASY